MALVAVLLDKCKTHSQLASDNALAVRFAVSRQVVCMWRAGTKYPSEDHIAQIAKCAAEDPGEWLVLINAERATGEARKAWAALARRLGAAAAVAAVALTQGAGMAAHAYKMGGLYIMSGRRWCGNAPTAAA